MCLEKKLYMYIFFKFIYLCFLNISSAGAVSGTMKVKDDMMKPSGFFPLCPLMMISLIVIFHIQKVLEDSVAK